MNPVVISPTIQEHNGVRYYKRATGYFRSGGNGVKPQVLSRVVWSEQHGNIPHGWEMHHKNEDKSVNDYENLECLAPLDHLRAHRKTFMAVMSKKAIVTCSQCGIEFETKAAFPAKVCGKRCWNRSKRGD